MRQDMAEDLYLDFKDPSLDPKLKAKYARDANAIIRSVDEVLGRLLSRAQLAVTGIPASNCISGFSCGCGGGCDQVAPWPYKNSPAEASVTHGDCSNPEPAPVDDPEPTREHVPLAWDV
jgi:hypothetical protein